MKKELTVWEAACIITGYGIGGGVMSMPYLAARNGVFVGLLILVVAYLASLLMHMMVADLSLRADSGQIVSVFEKFLFKGKMKKFLTTFFFILITVVLLTTLATYIAGAGEIIEEYLPISKVLGRFLFYIIAASVVLFGLKAVGVSEKIAVVLIFALIGVFAIASFGNIRNQLPTAPGTWKETLAYYGMAMFAFTAFFSVPQAVEGLGGDEKKIKKALALGFLNVFIMIFVITLCALLASEQVTPLAMLGWSAGIGVWAQIVGAVFTLLAMVTTYWSISLALSDIIREQLKIDQRVCWLLATLPTLIMSFVGQGGFMEFMRLAAGLTAILIAFLVVPTARGADKLGPTRLMGKLNTVPVQIIVVAAYILMALGNLITIE